VADSELSVEDQERARRQFEQSLEDVDYDDVTYAAHKGESKVDKLDDDPPGPLLSLWNDIKLMVRMLKAYVTNSYREVPWRIIAAIAAAIAYFVMPLDAVPDFIPGVGYLDDALVVKLALDIVRQDLRKFEVWSRQQP
jgi:uncharacterized membrane protein YkvA (DUF1232 family)